MVVKCPNCGRSGQLPAGLESGSRKIRCPKCGVKFDPRPAKSLDENLPDPELAGRINLGGDLGITTALELEELPAITSQVGLEGLAFDEDDVMIGVTPRNEQNCTLRVGPGRAELPTTTGLTPRPGSPTRWPAGNPKILSDSLAHSQAERGIIMRPLPRI